MWFQVIMALMAAAASYQSNRAQADMINASSAAEAVRTKRAAEEAEAAGTQAAKAERRKAQIAASRAMAVAAASGSGGVGVETLISGIEAEGEKEAQYRKYESIERGKGLRDQGALTMWQGGVQSKQYRTAARNSLLMGAAKAGGSLYSNYSGGDPAPTLHGNNFQDADTGYAYYGGQ